MFTNTYQVFYIFSLHITSLTFESFYFICRTLHCIDINEGGGEGGEAKIQLIYSICVMYTNKTFLIIFKHSYILCFGDCNSCFCLTLSEVHSGVTLEQLDQSDSLCLLRKKRARLPNSCCCPDQTNTAHQSCNTLQVCS